MNDSDRAGGASAARNKLAGFLREWGIPVRSGRRGYPPTDEDFLAAIRYFETHPAEFDQVRIRFGPTEDPYVVLVPPSISERASEEPDYEYLLLTVERRRRGSRTERRFLLANAGPGEAAVFEQQLEGERETYRRRVFHTYFETLEG
jgi:hypothetical protein